MIQQRCVRQKYAPVSQHSTKQRSCLTCCLQEWGFSLEASFVAAPPVGPQTRVKVLAVADLGQGEVDGSMEQSEMLVSLNTTAR